jgi:hypothetical protein
MGQDEMSRPSSLRPTAADTPEARLAGVVGNLIEKFKSEHSHYPDIADFCEALQPHIRREILLAMLDEAQIPTIQRGDRIRAIVGELAELLLIQEMESGT